MEIGCLPISKRCFDYFKIWLLCFHDTILVENTEREKCTENRIMRLHLKSSFQIQNLSYLLFSGINCDILVSMHIQFCLLCVCYWHVFFSKLNKRKLIEWVFHYNFDICNQLNSIYQYRYFLLHCNIISIFFVVHFILKGYSKLI